LSGWNPICDEHQLLRSAQFLGAGQNVNELRAGLSGGSFGKGSTAEQGEASALMEALERYTGVYQGDEIRVLRRFSDFPPGDAMLPNEVLLYSDAQSESDQNPPSATPMRFRWIQPGSIHRQDGMVAGLVAARQPFQISSDQYVVFFYRVPTLILRIPTAAPPAIRARKPSCRASSNWWSGMPMRSGGTTASHAGSRSQPV